MDGQESGNPLRSSGLKSYREFRLAEEAKV